VNVLNGWKEIADHLHQGVRTVHRWETLGLPIHRLRVSTAGPVVAIVKELDAWQRAAPVALGVIGKKSPLEIRPAA
jgi:hypothetical protein